MAELTSLFRSRKFFLVLLILALIFVGLSISSYLKYRRKLFHLDLSMKLETSVQALNRIETSNKEMDSQIQVMKQLLAALERWISYRKMGFANAEMRNEY